MKSPKEKMSSEEIIEVLKNLVHSFEEEDARGRVWFASSLLNATDSSKSAIMLHKALVEYITWFTSPEYLKEVEEGEHDLIDDIEQFIALQKHNARCIARMLIEFADNPLIFPQN